MDHSDRSIGNYVKRIKGIAIRSAQAWILFSVLILALASSRHPKWVLWTGPIKYSWNRSLRHASLINRSYIRFYAAGLREWPRQRSVSSNCFLKTIGHSIKPGLIKRYVYDRSVHAISPAMEKPVWATPLIICVLDWRVAQEGFNQLGSSCHDLAFAFLFYFSDGEVMTRWAQLMESHAFLLVS